MSKNYFALFGLAPMFDINETQLEQRYRTLQSESHPDRFVLATPAEKLQSMQLATLANEAYDILKKPSSRAKYILSLAGIDATKETNTGMPAAFLMQQMEWRETLENLKSSENIDGLEDLANTMQAAAQSLTNELKIYIDESKDLTAATQVTRKLVFINSVYQDINKAIELLDN